jgi:hypothetical protein
MKSVKLTLLALAVVALFGCSASNDNYRSNSPKLVFDQFFDGRLCAWGVVKNRQGEMTRKFVARIDSETVNGTTSLDEIFRFDDGELQKRKWFFNSQGSAILGTANDVVGKATGEIFGDSVHLVYTLEVISDDDVWHVSMDDWLHLVDSNTMIGTTRMTKWGLDLGRIDITIQKRSNSDICIQEKTDA